MNLVSLKYFIAITEYSSFSKAAEHLYVTQPTLSRQIADLEKEFGVQLFERTKRSISLTDAGRILLDEAKEIVHRCDCLAKKIKNTQENMIGSLNIGYQGFLDNRLLSDSLKSLSKKYPQLSISLFHCNFAELNHFLMNGKFDVIFTIVAGLHTLPRVKRIKVEKNTLQIVVPSNHPFAIQTSVKVSDLADENFIMLERSTCPFPTDYVVELCLKNGFSPNVSCYVHDAQTSFLMVGSGKGIAFMSSRVLVHNMEDVKFLSLKDCDLDFDIVMAFKEENRNPAIPLFISEVKNKSIVAMYE
ncbi:MAG: Hydrogen peroxide-inducible genes activator [Candidatus Dichloromethanomonas elyunquensis]|nr:MAG: Hydrogen peroxide-inducible genes activator [Candidatus Dichloromethanomonas elyunquensis]